jgi:lipid-binding SYLF domain-containing protein
MLKLTRVFVVALISVVGILAQQATAEARATIQLTIFKAGFILGVGGGSGVLTVNGKQYPVTVGGVSLGATIGVSQADLVGTVYNLRDPADIEGAYSGGGAGLAIAGGSSVATISNARGVVLKLRGRQVGFSFSINLSGMTISLRR